VCASALISINWGIYIYAANNGHVEVGAPAVIGRGLALSFGLYGAVKKVVPTDPRVSVGVEAAVAAPFALAYIAVLEGTGPGTFTDLGAGHIALLVLSGAVTALPLLLFAAAAQRLPLVTMGLLFYVTPAMQLTWGIFVGHEPMPPARWLGFALIWLALLVFSADALRRSRATSPEGPRNPEREPEHRETPDSSARPAP
jgi:chloramphenicol-sensitive protein RarD